MRTEKRLNKVFSKAKRVSFDNNSKIIIMSDAHRGDGNWNDEFARNQNIYFHALLHYYNNDYTYIELGDGDELWEVSKISDIINDHNDVFELLSLFHANNRLHMLYGNHDICKKKCKLVKKQFSSYFNEISRKEEPLFSDIEVHEGLVLVSDADNEIFLVHGHQGDFINDQIWPVSRFLVRYVWRNLELLGIQDPTKVAKNNKARTKIENKLIKWSRDNNQMIIAGHTHRPLMPKPYEHKYFNDGSGIHPRCITGIEIVDGKISLIKWSVKSKIDGTLFVAKDIVSGPIRLSSYFNHLKR